MKKQILSLFLSLVAILSFGFTVHARSGQITCVQNVSETAPTSDLSDPALLGLWAEVSSDLSLKNIRVDLFPQSNDNETLINQEFAAPGVDTKSLSYNLENNVRLVLPKNFQNQNKFTAILYNLKLISLPMDFTLSCENK